MNNSTRYRTGLTAGLVLAAALAAPPVLAAPDFCHGLHASSPQMQQRLQSRLQARLDRMAERLEIKASQQEAWQAYVRAHQEQFDPAALKPLPPEADATTIARQRADMAARLAQRLAALAEATAKLQQALTPEQARLLAELMRQPLGGRRHGAGGHGRQGGPH